MGDVQAWQSVNGWLSFDDKAGNSDNPAHFAIRDPTGWELNNTNSIDHNYGSEGERETFVFTAKITGNWSAYVWTSEYSGGSFNYSFTFGPTPILGLDRINFIGWVITGGVFSELVVFLYYRRRKADMS